MLFYHKNNAQQKLPKWKH